MKEKLSCLKQSETFSPLKNCHREILSGLQFAKRGHEIKYFDVPVRTGKAKNVYSRRSFNFHLSGSQTKFSTFPVRQGPLQ